MVDYSKWDNMVKEIESMDSEEVAKNVQCEIGKPLTEEEFRNLQASERSNVMQVGNVPVSRGGKVELDMKKISKG